MTAAVSCFPKIPCVQTPAITKTASSLPIPLSTGIVGEKDSKIKILFLNGARYSYDDCSQAARRVSEVFSQSKVHFAHLPLTLWDVARSVVREPPVGLASSVAATIRSHLENKVDAQKLLIVAHSGGANVLDASSSLLTAQERSNIDVVTVGACRHFKPGVFRKVIPIVGKTDLAARLCQLVTGGLSGIFSRAATVGSWFEWPWVSHRFLTLPNLSAIKKVATDYAFV